MEKLTEKLNYQFSDRRLLKLALTHCSAGRENNERLEFLGDAVLGLVISSLLYTQYPGASEGELSRLRARLVQQSTLADIARSLDLGRYLVLGSGEQKAGGANRDSILADALEALISALYLDAGLARCQALIAAWFQPLLTRRTDPSTAKDAKTSLQEVLQARKLPLPVYTISDIKGKDHQQEFLVECAVVLLDEPVAGLGASRKEAEQKAAALVLELIGQPHV